MMRRHGIMLLEMGVAMTAAAVLLYGAVFIFTSFQRIDRTARERVQFSRELARLTEQFRADVHAALEIEEAGDISSAGTKPLVRLSGDKMAHVEYTVGENGQLVRIAYEAGKIVERDVFDIGAGAKFSIDVRREGASLATLVVANSPEASGEVNPPSVQRRISALLARDRRFAGGNRAP
jgi:type II secretory pathway component PulJ